MKKVLFLVLLIVGAFNFSGCVSNQGNSAILEQNMLDKFVVNKTTKIDAITLLGKPPYTQRLLDREVFAYYFNKSEFGITIFTTDTAVEMSTLTLQFNSNGVLIEKSLTGQSYDTKNQTNTLGF